MEIQIIGHESVALRTLEHHVREAVRVLRVESTIRTADDPELMKHFHIVFDPGLIIDGHVAWQGGIPAFETIVQTIIEETEHPADM